MFFLLVKNEGEFCLKDDTLSCPPAQDASPHQDYYTFSRDPYKSSFATVTGRGDKPKGYPPGELSHISHPVSVLFESMIFRTSSLV